MVPGRQRIGVPWTILVGIAAAWIGTVIAEGLDVAETEGVDWVELWPCRSGWRLWAWLLWTGASAAADP